MRAEKTKRENMVENQIEPGGVDNEALLEAFRIVPREEFLPERYKPLACVDEDICLANGFFMMEPLVLARMLQLARPHEGDIVLNIGDHTGYSSAILSDIVTTIVAMESRPGMFDMARQIWADMDYCNIAVIDGKLRNGCPEHAPYSLIVLNGAAADIPSELTEQLSVGGRLVCIIRKSPRDSGKIVMVKRETETAFSKQAFYDASTPFLKEFSPGADEFSMKEFA